MTEHVGVELRDAILVMSFARVNKRNAITNEMYGALADAIEEAESDRAVRVLLFRAEGESFTSGNDLGEFAATARGVDTGPRHVGRFLRTLATASKPIVAAVRGKAVGVGTTMLLHCDQVMLADDAELTTPFVNLALVPEAASSLLLPARIGHARAFSMFALGEPLRAADALAWGLANAIVSPAELDGAALALAARLARQPLGALMATKRLMRDGAAVAAAMATEAAEFEARLRSPEARKAFAAFAERRPPNFAKVA